jgi:hypothetical protein
MPESTTFSVDRSISIRASIADLQKLDWNIYGDLSILDTAPSQIGHVTELYLFGTSVDERYIPIISLKKKYTELGLSIDVQAFIQYLKAHPDFADERPVIIEWYNDSHKPCNLAFGRWNGVRYVNIGQGPIAWSGNYVLIGCLKPGNSYAHE